MGAPYQVFLISSFLPKVGDMLTKQVAESQIELGGLPTGALYGFAALDENQVVMASAQISIPVTSQPVWGHATWGQFNWTNTQSIVPSTYPVPWPYPLVFEKMVIAVSASAGPNVSIGTFYARYQRTGFMTLGPNFLSAPGSPA